MFDISEYRTADLTLATKKIKAGAPIKTQAPGALHFGPMEGILFFYF
jgi:hypothetical protein